MDRLGETEYRRQRGPELVRDQVQELLFQSFRVPHLIERLPLLPEQHRVGSRSHRLDDAAYVLGDLRGISGQGEREQYGSLNAGLTELL
jgi:hypothetical protein